MAAICREQLRELESGASRTSLARSLILPNTQDDIPPTPNNTPAALSGNTTPFTLTASGPTAQDVEDALNNASTHTSTTTTPSPSPLQPLPSKLRTIEEAPIQSPPASSETPQEQEHWSIIQAPTPPLTPAPPPNSPEAWPFKPLNDGAASPQSSVQTKHEELREKLGKQIQELSLEEARTLELKPANILSRMGSKSNDPTKTIPAEPDVLADEVGKLDLKDTKIEEEKIMKAPADQNHYELRNDGGKGYGAFALRTIARGTRIIADKPLLAIDHFYYFQDEIEEAFRKLSPEDQKRYFELHSAHGQDPANWPSRIHPDVAEEERKRITQQHEARVAKEPSVISIFQTNCMEKGKGAGVFYHAARFNHSCEPNAFFSWNSIIGCETIHAIRDIHAGEEIVLCYCNRYHERELRKWELKHYGFTCNCPACQTDSSLSSHAEQTRHRRYRYSELHDELKPFRGLTKEHLPALLEMASLQLAEGDWTDSLSWTYLNIAQICEENRDFKAAYTATKKCLQIQMDCRGTDSGELPIYVSLVNRLKERVDKMTK